MKATLVIGTLCAVGWLLTASVVKRDVWVNGKKSILPALEHEGEVYVPASALKAAGAEVTMFEQRISVQFIPTKGQEQLEAVEGIIGEYVANRVWRVKVIAVEPATNPFIGRGPGYRVKFEARNLSERAQSMHGSGLDKIQLVDKDGKLLSPSDSSFKDR